MKEHKNTPRKVVALFTWQLSDMPLVDLNFLCHHLAVCAEPNLWPKKRGRYAVIGEWSWSTKQPNSMREDRLHNVVVQHDIGKEEQQEVEDIDSSTGLQLPRPQLPGHLLKIISNKDISLR
ncbi:hypothetical protein CR513_31725, partial [Mucuna pruriens]